MHTHPLLLFLTKRYAEACQSAKKSCSDNNLDGSVKIGVYTECGTYSNSQYVRESSEYKKTRN